MKEASRRVADFLTAAGMTPEIVDFSLSTKTAAEAAQAIGTEVGRIVKSLVFIADDEPIVILMAGHNRLDVDRLATQLARKIRRAGADEVRQATGFAIGGVPPVAHARHLPIYIDQDLLAYERVYAAAGTPNAVFAISPTELQRISGGTVLDVAERPTHH